MKDENTKPVAEADALRFLGVLQRGPSGVNGDDRQAADALRFLGVLQRG